MPNAEPEPAAADASAAAPVATPESPLAGFSAAIQGWGDPQPVEPTGQSEEPKAVETSVEEKAPEASTDKPPEKAEPEKKAEEKPDPTKTVNFDGFSDKQIATYTRLLKAGFVTPEEVEESRKNSLRQNYFSKRTAEVNLKEKALEEKFKGREDDLALLDKIRGSERLLTLWEKMQKAPVEDAAAEDPEGLADRKTAAQIAKEAIEAHEREKAAKAAIENAGHEKRAAGIRTALGEAKAALGVSDEALDVYLTEIAAKFPPGTNPIEHIIRNISPSDLRERIEYRHEIAQAKAAAKAALEQSSKTTQKAVQASKQSLSPSPRVAESEVNLSPFQRAKRDLGITRLSEVQGAGFPTNGR